MPVWHISPRPKVGTTLWSHDAAFLYRVARTKIVRHVKVIADATPYDPAYTSYFVRRKHRRRTLDSAGYIDGSLTADFQGDVLPTPDDLALVGVACLGILPSFRRMNAIHDCICKA